MKFKNLPLFLVILFLTSNCTTKKTDDKFDYELLPIESNEKWGYIDHEGKYVINPQFKDAKLFCEGLALVKNKEDKYGYINKEGTFVISPEYKSASNFSEGLAYVTLENGHPTCINSKGEVQFVLKDYDYAATFSEGLSLVGKDKLAGYVDPTGKIVINLQFDASASFNEGLAVFGEKSKEDSTKYLFGFIDKNGKIEIPAQFDQVYDFSEGLAVVEDGGQYGYINNKGVYVINPQFELARNFSNGVARVKQGDLWGYINKQGAMQINPQFEGTRDFNNGLAAVTSGNDKWGFIDAKGKYVINPQFTASGDFNCEFAPVSSGKKIGFITNEGKYVINPQYTSCYGYNSNLHYFRVANSFPKLENINSDYYDPTDIVLAMVSYESKSKFNNLKSNMALQDILKIKDFKEMKEDSEYSTIVKYDSNITSEAILVDAVFQFANPIYKNVKRYSYGIEMGEYKKYDFNAVPKSCKFSYKINNFGKVKGKEKTIAIALENKLKEFYETKDPASFKSGDTFGNDLFDFKVTFEESNIYVEVIFKDSSKS